MGEDAPGPARALGHRPTAEAVLEAIAAMVERAGLKPGDRLPPELALARELGVGRTTIREAMTRWEGAGLVRRRRGDGTYLVGHLRGGGNSPVPASVRLEGTALLRLLEVRRVIEAAVVRKAAVAASPAQRREILARMERLLAVVARGEAYRDADMLFHAAVAEATGNPMFGQILARLDEMFERSEHSPFTRTDFGLSSFPHHRTLAEAIAAGDADAAEAALHAILDEVEGTIRELIGEAPPRG